MFISGCAAKPKPTQYVPPQQVNQKLGSWDHNQIRQARETEAAATSNEIPEAINNTKNCIIMTAEEMGRAKTTGCTPIDPRAGHGENAYCCPDAAE